MLILPQPSTPRLLKEKEETNRLIIVDFLFSVIPLRFERRTHALEGFIQKDGYLIAYQVNIYIFAFGKDTHWNIFST